MLRTLAEREIYLAVVSNKTGELLRREVAQLGWSGFFGRIVGAGDAPSDKPASDPVHLALQPSGVPPGDEVWFVGDTAIDMECARNSGCVAVLLRNAEPPEECAREFARFAPHLSFADEADLFRSLEGLRFGATRPSS
jgi:phosphoglycolate phosphatase